MHESSTLTDCAGEQVRLASPKVAKSDAQTCTVFDHPDGPRLHGLPGHQADRSSTVVPLISQSVISEYRSTSAKKALKYAPSACLSKAALSA